MEVNSRVNMHGRLDWTKYDENKLKTIENSLLAKKLCYKVIGNKVLKKKGSTSGKTLYYVSNDEVVDYNNAELLSLLNFTKLYNSELDYAGYQSVYSKMIRSNVIFNYLLSKNLLTYKIFYRKKKGTDELVAYVKYFIERDKKETVLNFYKIYLTSKKVNNLKTIRDRFLKLNNKTMVAVVDEVRRKNVNVRLNRQASRIRKIRK